MEKTKGSSMTKLNGWKKTPTIILVCVASAITAQAQTLTTLASFDGRDGSGPDAPLVQGIDGNLYGTTYSIGTRSLGYGVMFRVAAGDLTHLHTFCLQKNCIDGANPSGILQSDRNLLVGTTILGGNGYGTVFSFAGGKLNTLHSFDGSDGAYPAAGMMQAVNGDFYGTTANYGQGGGGTIFRITAQGAFTTLYSFCSQPNCADGSEATNLIQATDGNFYGTTMQGGNAPACNYTDGCGTIFKITPAGKLSTLYSFCNQINSLGYCADGGEPRAGLIQGTDGNFYGTTELGGTEECYNTNGGCGTIFEITPQGDLTTLYSFCAQKTGQGYCADGSIPLAGLIQATDGNLYGTTYDGGEYGEGTVFEISTQGTYERALYSFYCTENDCTDGAGPEEALLQATDGNLYGTTPFGGNSSCSFENSTGCGTVFELSVGLNPFVETLPVAAGVGAEVGVQGTDLTGATGVAFNNVPANFTVRLPSLIVTTVPASATTGYVTVTTPTGVLTSNVPFQVIQ
jgi:uncharacterized repeat protein (TIGR03803 family)